MPPIVIPPMEKKPDVDATDTPILKPKISTAVYFSFYVPFVLLLTTGTITFIEALRTPDPAVRHIMNLETCISIVAGYFYSIFAAKLDDWNAKGMAIDWSYLAITRYTDWAITTPLMLLGLCLVSKSNTHIPVTVSIITLVWLLNYVMLYIGYLGETGGLSRWTATWMGFLPFFAMMYVIFTVFILPKYNLANYVLFFMYLIVWSMYGLCYMLTDAYRNIALNALDCLSKCLVGLGLWAYYTKVIQIK